jgi:hypothetical protein
MELPSDPLVVRSATLAGMLIRGNARPIGRHLRPAAGLPQPVLLSAAFSLALACLPGCSKSGPDVVRVQGTVTRHGQPIPNLTVNFMPEKGRPSWGLTDLSGHYTLHYNPKIDGALLGRHRVFVVFRGPAGPEAEQALFRGKLPPLHPDAEDIKRRFGKPETTPLNVTVQKDRQVVDLQLD